MPKIPGTYHLNTLGGPCYAVSKATGSTKGSLYIHFDAPSDDQHCLSGAALDVANAALTQTLTKLYETQSHLGGARIYFTNTQIDTGEETRKPYLVIQFTLPHENDMSRLFTLLDLCGLVAPDGGTLTEHPPASLQNDSALVAQSRKEQLASVWRAVPMQIETPARGRS